ncbi:hypothetical protein H632_c4130p0 [Helicosporidium sp. ATCC 50920]|nr:hypothetical protein H632_c4130p0 [Helicosporidium sp. ATCC 50920]|eukprot:KDD71943.1 hypothetical protein H632_c4130p0 [Helicosporidium sp. ATCC 50920]
MGGYLGFDGFTSTFQDALFRGYDMTIFNQMLYITAFSALLSLSGLVASGQIFTGLAFFSRHPDALISALILSAAATVGQMFISHTIKSYGALLFATAMTTRQFVSILLSAVIFGHAMSKGQLLGACLVFGALYAKTFASGHKGPVLPAPQTAGQGPAAAQVEGQPLLPVHEPPAEAAQEKNAAN